jgi:Icc protein
MIVQLSDLHVEIGVGAERAAHRLEAAVASINALPMRPDAVLVTGDLVHHPSEASYARARELLVGIGAPLYVLPGNHDDRDGLRAAFGDGAGPAAEPGGAVHYTTHCGDLNVVTLDTIRPGLDGGRLDEAELAWLDAELATTADRPTILAMHHPPFVTGVPSMDEIGLPAPDREALAAVLARHPHVELITAGHVHRTVFTHFADRPAMICPSTDIQLELDFRPTSHDYSLVHEPPGFAVHKLIDGRIVSHVQPVGRFDAVG